LKLFRQKYYYAIFLCQEFDFVFLEMRILAKKAALKLSVEEIN